MKEAFRLIGSSAFIVILIAVLFSYAMFQGGFVSWFLFFSFLPISIYHLGLLFYPIKKWKVSRELSHQIIQAGDSISATIKIERRFPFPLYYCIIEEVFPRTLMKVDSRKEKYHYMDQPSKLNVARRSKRLSFPWFKRVIELPYTIHQVPRGEHQLRAIRVKTGDLFGFIKKLHVFEIENEIIVYPTIRDLYLAEKFSSFEQGFVTSNTLNPSNTNVAVGVREYVPGDRFSWIDWKQTARKNTVMTKEFEQDKSTDILIALDSCYYEEMNYLAFEAAVEMTNSLIELFRRQDTKAGLLSIGRETIYFSLEQTIGNRSNVKQFLTCIEPGGERPFSVQLKEEMNRMNHAGIIIFVTTHIDDFLKRSIQLIRLHTKQVAVLFIQSETAITEEEHQLIQKLRYANVGVQILTEQQLVNNPLEVNIR